MIIDKLSAKERETARKKRKEDPNPNRRGKAKNVSQKSKRKKEMNLSTEQLQQIIKEELENVLDEKDAKKERNLGKVEEEKLEKRELKDACYRKVKSRYKVWPSAYASGALVKCRKVGAKNWGNKSKKNEALDEVTDKEEEKLNDIEKSWKKHQNAQKQADRIKKITMNL